MMKVLIEYYNIIDDHILAFPKYTNSEVIEVENEQQLDEYISKQTDQYGNAFKKPGYIDQFQYTSHSGAVKITWFDDLEPEYALYLKLKAKYE